MAASPKTTTSDLISKLIAQYGCGPIKFSGTDEAFYERHLLFDNVVDASDVTLRERYEAVARSVRDVLSQRWIRTEQTYERENPKRVYYLSIEFLLGRSLGNNIANLMLDPVAAQLIKDKNLDWTGLLEQEPDPGLGNGGLGRLAACFLESLATLDYPAFGYGLRYSFGIFRQEFQGGWQRERPDNWLRGGYAWEVARRDLTVPVRIGGKVARRATGERSPESWVDAHVLYGVPHDVLVAGFGTPTVSVLRLWKAQAPDEFDFDTFSKGDFLAAVEGRERAEAVTKVLYPSDEAEAGRELRLTQEYFLVACSVVDIIRRFRERHGERWELFPE